MQVKLDRRFSNGLLWYHSYTLGAGQATTSNDDRTISTPADLERS